MLGSASVFVSMSTGPQQTLTLPRVRSSGKYHVSRRLHKQSLLTFPPSQKCAKGVKPCVPSTGLQPKRRLCPIVSASLASSAPVRVGAYPETWSNRDGCVLRPIAEDLWVAERPFVWNSIDVGGRMAVVKLPDGQLWVHSPVDLDDKLRKELEVLGPVGHIVSPNYEHLKWAQQWIDAFPNAQAFAPPYLLQKGTKIKFTSTMGEGNNDAPGAWGGAFALTSFADLEHNPFTKRPFFNEVLFVHLKSGSLIVTDLYWNYPSDVPLGTSAWKFGMDVVLGVSLIRQAGAGRLEAFELFWHHDNTLSIA
eukprot:jgi/Mesvir1/29315/Mv01573-RA.1